MSTQQLDSDTIIFDLESFLADNDPTTRGLDLDTQAAITALVWEIHGIIDIAEASKQSINTAHGLKRLRTIAGLLMTLLQPDDAALDLAETQVAALPWGATLQAILTHQVGHFVDEREYRKALVAYE